MNKYKKLVNNSLVFAIGNLGTKLIIFFLLPIYTYYLSKSEFGLVDLLTTTISLLIPIFTLSIFDSVLRFAMDKNYDKQEILINSFVVILIGFILLVMFYPIISHFLPFENYIIYFYILILFQSIYTTLSQYIRAIGLISLFAFSGIFNAMILLVSNVFLLIIFHTGIVGYLTSLIITNLISCLFIIIKGKVEKDLVFNKINIKLMKEMVLYSIPLIPNALMWWIMSFSDRFIISYLIGLSANGIYAVASKIPSILNIFNSIFFQAWQMSAIEEKESKDKTEFFSKVFNVFSIFMLISTSFILAHLKLIIGIFIADSFFESWKYVPFLLLGVVFSSFSGFLGTNYIAAKKTTGVFRTSLIGAILNVCTNLLLIPIIGINGATIGTMLSFLVIWILRIIDTKKFVNIIFNIRNLILTLIVLLIQIGIMYLNSSFEYCFEIGLFLILILINRIEINEILVRLRNMLRDRRKV
ncbi:polysaccharide biosynthesis C-terminal domain-containing protein [Gottfriedia acidiceleris]|uniref:lipopolysaccharide biosynthesis protein n=1 Tax=Gottfriedia acidiceleris TaxID=371036 RepID=UPI002FFFB5B9